MYQNEALPRVHAAILSSEPFDCSARIPVSVRDERRTLMVRCCCAQMIMLYNFSDSLYRGLVAPGYTGDGAIVQLGLDLLGDLPLWADLLLVQASRTRQRVTPSSPKPT